MKITYKLLIISFVALVIVLTSQKLCQTKLGSDFATFKDTSENIYYIENPPQPKFECIDLGVPSIDSSFKTWMSYKAVTDKNSPQYKYIQAWGWVDNEGFMRCYGERDLGIEQDYYLVALGSYYGTTIGTKYRITLDTGKVFYVVLADCKDDKHTNSTNQYVLVNGNVVEFLVDTSKLNKDVKRMGSANIYEPLNGSIIKIERIDFIK